MNGIEKQIKNATEHIALTDTEKRVMRERLVSYMAYKPIRTSAAQRSGYRRHHPVLSFFRAAHLSGALVIALVVTSSTFGVSLAATNALPGDILYPVKVNINEEVKSALLTSDKDRIEWDRQRAELRLSEASQLAAEGRLNPARQEEVSRRFAQHTEAVVNSVLAVEKKDPVLAAEVSTEFEASLDTHEAVLARLIVEQNDIPDEGARDLVEQVRSAALEAGKIREDAEEKIAVNQTEDTKQVDTVDGTQDVADDTEDTAPKDSANLRERAVYQVQERATANLKEAETRLAALDAESELTSQATAQIASGKALMEEGAKDIDTHQLADAYGAYRRAAAAFQKVAQLLQMAVLFSIEIYPDVVSTTSEDVATGTNTTVGDEGTYDETTLMSMRDQAQAAIQETQTLLLTQEGYEKDVVSRANSLLKDAAANVLRGEIAMVLGENKDASKRFDTAHSHALRAKDILTTASERDTDVTGVTIDTPSEPDAASTTEGTTTAPVFTLVHSYATGTHTYTGEVTVENPCSDVVATSSVASSSPEEITLMLTTATSSDNGVTCTPEATSRPFSVSAAAAEDAVLAEVTLDGTPRTWDVVALATTTELLGEDVNTPADDSPSLLRRAIETTEDLLHQ